MPTPRVSPELMRAYRITALLMIVAAVLFVVFGG